MIHSNYHSVILLGSVFRWTVKDALRGNTCFIISSPALFLSLGFKHSFPTTPFTIYIYHWPHHRVSKSFSGAVLPPSVMVSFGSFTEALHYCRRWTIRVWVRLGQKGSKRKSANLSLNLTLCFWWRPQEKWFHRAATLHNVYIVQFVFPLDRTRSDISSNLTTVIPFNIYLSQLVRLRGKWSKLTN